MRLLRLKIRNIASLRGEHEVNFEDIQRHSSLFAITGETGAGKSTILNSIGLALYGQVYKKNVQQIDLVTLGEKDGSIELIFQAGGKTYLADWRARARKQNGEPYSTPQSPVRILYELEGKEFSSPKKATEKKVDELLNLDFDQFCKCIILNQGEFARFLSSSFTERKEILEKLYPGELLESMGRELRAELDLLEREKNELEIKLGELKVDEVSGEELKARKVTLKNELDQLEAAVVSVDKLDRHFASLRSYHEKNLTNERKKEELRLTLKSETSKFNELLKNGEILAEAQHKAQSELDRRLPELQECLKKEEQIRNITESLAALETREKNLQKDQTLQKERLDKTALLFNESQIKLKEALSKITGNYQDLKAHAEELEPFIDRVSEKDLLEKEKLGKSEILKVHELSGKELSLLVKTLEQDLSLMPKDLTQQEASLNLRRKELKELQEKGQRLLVIREEAQKESQRLALSVKKLFSQIEDTEIQRKRLQDELLPLETTLSLQEVFMARDVCLTHAIAENAKACPVCEAPVTKDQLAGLKERLGGADFNSMRQQRDLKKNELIRVEAETKSLQQRLQEEEKLLALKSREAGEEATGILVRPQDIEALDKELEELRTQVLRKTTLEKDLAQRKGELERIRTQYAETRAALLEIQEKLTKKSSDLDKLHENLKPLIPEITPEGIRELKLLRQQYLSYQELEARHQKVSQEREHIVQNLQRLEAELHSLRKESAALKEKSQSLSAEVSAKVGNVSAASLIKKLTDDQRTHAEALRRHQENQKRHELTLKDSQGRLSQMDELSKDYDLQFAGELHALREAAKTVPDSLLRFRDLSLDLSSPSELFPPLTDLIALEKKALREKADACRMTYSSVTTRLADWEKLQDKIQLLELKHKDAKDALARKHRLFEVLGKDELRTFVLSLVEENLIIQTNEELQKLCQGRYEIVHQTRSMKMMPEFYILDKFREGARRKVSTLSGGETFMVSLAMALGLAEMTRGKAEIDSLFIDEGFGTLDQDSLGDVLDMLQQIQTRGLLVGLISHVKTLTDSLAVNLRVNKNSSGNSSVELQLN